MAEIVVDDLLSKFLLVIATIACFGVVGFFIAHGPMEILASLARLPYVGTAHYEFPIAAVADGDEDEAAQPIDVPIRGG